MLTATRLTSDVNMTEMGGTDPGAWLQRERERADVSQNKVAARAGINVIHLSRIENGHSGLKRDTLERIVIAINELSDIHTVDLDEARRRFGYASGEDEDLLPIGDRAQVKLADKNLSAEEQREIAEELALAYEVIMARRKRRADATEN